MKKLGDLTLTQGAVFFLLLLPSGCCPLADRRFSSIRYCCRCRCFNCVICSSFSSCVQLCIFFFFFFFLHFIITDGMAMHVPRVMMVMLMFLSTVEDVAIARFLFQICFVKLYIVHFKWTQTNHNICMTDHFEFKQKKKKK